MRKILSAYAFLALAACASQEPVGNSDDGAIENVAETEAANEMSVAGMTFEVEDEPGVDRTIFGTDGSFTDYYQGEVTRRGTYEQRADGQLCFTYAGEAAGSGEVKECWTMKGEPDADGWATSVRLSDGLTIRARPVTE